MFYDVGFHSSTRRILLIRSLSLISESARTHASHRHVFHLSRAVIRRRANARVHARTHTHARLLPEAESTEEAECGTNSYPIHPNHASRVCLLVKVVKPRLCRSPLPLSLSLSLSFSLTPNHLFHTSFFHTYVRVSVFITGKYIFQISQRRILQREA